MAQNYQILYSPDFLKRLGKLLKKDKSLEAKVQAALEKLASDPFHPGLKTHKADTKLYGYKHSSRVTGDIRIIWDFDGERIVLLYSVSGHEVYK